MQQAHCRWRQQGQYTATPNPAVGCVLVKDGAIVGAGISCKSPAQPHAERVALADAGEKAAQGATAYVTLRTLCPLW